MIKGRTATLVSSFFWLAASACEDLCERLSSFRAPPPRRAREQEYGVLPGRAPPG